MDPFPAKRVQVVLVRGNGLQGIGLRPVQEAAAEVFLAQAFTIKEQHAGIHILPMVHAHIAVYVLHEGGYLLDGIVGHGTHQFVFQVFLPQPGDVPGHHQVGIQVDGLVVLGEQRRNEETEVNGERSKGAEAVLLQGVHTRQRSQTAGQGEEFHLEVRAGEGLQPGAVGRGNVVGKDMDPVSVLPGSVYFDGRNGRCQERRIGVVNGKENGNNRFHSTFSLDF